MSIRFSAYAEYQQRQYYPLVLYLPNTSLAIMGCLIQIVVPSLLMGHEELLYLIRGNAANSPSADNSDSVPEC